MQLKVTDTFALAGRGTVALVGSDPIPLAFGSRHRILITRPDGGSLEAVAIVEAMRKDPPGEVAALHFREVEAGQVVLGSSLSVLGEVRDA